MLGGVYRVAQPHDIRLKFLHPKPTSLTSSDNCASSIPQAQELSSSDFLLPLPLSSYIDADNRKKDVAVSLSAGGITEDRALFDVPSLSRGSTTRAIGAALGQVVRSTTDRLRPARSTRSAVLAPPEEDDDDDEYVAAVEPAGNARIVAGASDLSLSSAAPASSSSTSSRRSHHLKGYATVPQGFISPSAGKTFSQRFDRVPSERSPRSQEAPLVPNEVSQARSVSSSSSDAIAQPNEQRGLEKSSDNPAPESPPRPSQASSVARSVAALLTPSALFSRVSSLALRHRGNAAANPLTETAASSLTTGASEPLAPAAHNVGRGALLVVPMGGEFGDTEPAFVQVDGEGYKVFALRRLELAFTARALMVTFK